MVRNIETPGFSSVYDDFVCDAKYFNLGFASTVDSLR